MTQTNKDTEKQQPKENKDAQREEIVKQLWKMCDKDGITVRDRLREPLMVHVKELMDGSDMEVDVEDAIVRNIEQGILEWHEQQVAEAVEKERERMFEKIKHQGTVIYQGELPYGIHGLLIDVDKLKELIYTDQKGTNE